MGLNGKKKFYLKCSNFFSFISMEVYTQTQCAEFPSLKVWKCLVISTVWLDSMGSPHKERKGSPYSKVMPVLGLWDFDEEMHLRLSVNIDAWVENIPYLSNSRKMLFITHHSCL